MGFTREDVEYCYEYRKDTDFIRLMKTYKIIKEEAERINRKDVKKNRFETGLNVGIISKETGLSPSIVRKRLQELKNLGTVHYSHHSSGGKTIIYLIDSRERSFLDEMLEKAQKENLL